MERDWVGEINKLKRPLVEFQTKNLAEQNPKLKFFQPALQAHFQKMQQLGIRPTDVVCLGG